MITVRTGENVKWNLKTITSIAVQAIRAIVVEGQLVDKSVFSFFLLSGTENKTHNTLDYRMINDGDYIFPREWVLLLFIQMDFLHVNGL